MGSFQLKAPRLSALAPTEHEYQNPKNSWFVDDFRNFQSQTWLWLKLLWLFSYYQGYHYVRLCPHPLWVLKHIKTFVRNLRTFTKIAPHQPIPDILPPSSDLDVVNARSCCTRASADLKANAKLWRADIYIKKVGGIIIKFMSVCIMYIMNFLYHTSFIKFLYWTYCECVDYVDCSIALMHHVSWKGEWKLDQLDDLQSSTPDALKPRIHVTFAESLYSDTNR